MARPRIAVVTPLFPLRAEPYRGKPIHSTVVELQRFAEIEVFCPIATYPELPGLKPKTYEYRKADPTYVVPGIERTHYFEYPVLPLVSRPLNGFVSSRKLLPKLRQFRPDLVLSYWLYPEGYGAVRAAKRLGVPSVVGARGSDLRSIKDRIVKQFTQQTVRQANMVLTVSEELREQAIRFGAVPEKVRTILNGCDQRIFHPGDRQEARRVLGLKPDAPVIVFVGHLIPTKGVRELLQASVELVQSFPDLQIICIGEGSLRAELEQAGKLRLLGACTGEEVARWLTAATVFCLPSYSEGCPNVVLEALSCDRFVVATSVGGVPELITPECGILVPPGVVPKLRDALREALTKQIPAGSIAQKFQRGWDKVAEETFNACSELLGT